MVALDFPASPTIGQVYNNWTYDGTKWELTGTDGTSGNSRFIQIGSASPSTLRLFVGGLSTGTGNLTTTSPFTWAVNDQINASFSALVKRV